MLRGTIPANRDDPCCSAGNRHKSPNDTVSIYPAQNGDKDAHPIPPVSKR